jgi:hypothetical protein
MEGVEMNKHDVTVKHRGRVRYNASEKREGFSVTMAPSVYNAVRLGMTQGSFSMKLEHALSEWMEYRQMLIQYRDDTQKRNGTPERLNRTAERVFACAEFQNGYSYQEGRYCAEVTAAIEIAMQQNTPLKVGGMVWIEQILVPALRQVGLVVQVTNEVENDLFDVWVSGSACNTFGKSCGNCEVVMEISRYLQDMLNKTEVIP